jgi:hypothetical protein
MESGSRGQGSSWALEEEGSDQDQDFVVEELADTSSDEASDEGSDSGSDLPYEPESEPGQGPPRRPLQRSARDLCSCADGATAPAACVPAPLCQSARAPRFSRPAFPSSAGGLLEEEGDEGSLQQSLNTRVGWVRLQSGQRGTPWPPKGAQRF